MKLKFDLCVLFITAVFFLSLGCDSTNTRKTIERDGQPSITMIENDDPKMNAAMKKARASIDEFVVAFNKADASTSAFAIKVEFTQGEDTEHMWVLPGNLDSGKYQGVLNNEPAYITNVKLGDNVKFGKSEISDWMYVRDGKLVGGYTLRVLRNTLSDDHRKEFDSNLDFTID